MCFFWLNRILTFATSIRLFRRCIIVSRSESMCSPGSPATKRSTICWTSWRTCSRPWVQRRALEVYSHTRNSSQGSARETPNSTTTSIMIHTSLSAGWLTRCTWTCMRTTGSILRSSCRARNTPKTAAFTFKNCLKELFNLLNKLTTRRWRQRNWTRLLLTKYCPSSRRGCSSCLRAHSYL